jgi:hypothetical protein
MIAGGFASGQADAETRSQKSETRMAFSAPLRLCGENKTI